MGAIRERAALAFDSGPSTSPYQPRKDDPERGIVPLFGVVEDAIDAERGARQQAIADVDAKAQDAKDLAMTGAKPAKDPVRIVITAATAYAAITAGSTHDGVVVASGDRVLRAYNGDTGDVLNGPLVVQPSGPAVRATDMDANDEVVGSRWSIAAGTHAGEEWNVRNTGAVTIGSTPIRIAMSQPANAINAEVIGARGGRPSVNGRLNDMTAGIVHVEGLQIYNETEPVPIGAYPLSRYLPADTVIRHLHAETTHGAPGASIAIQLMIDGAVAYGPVEIVLGTPLDVSGLSITAVRGKDVRLEVFDTTGGARGMWIQADGGIA